MRAHTSHINTHVIVIWYRLPSPAANLIHCSYSLRMFLIIIYSALFMIAMAMLDEPTAHYLQCMACVYRPVSENSDIDLLVQVRKVYH
jgi:hypothetical protein